MENEFIGCKESEQLEELGFDEKCLAVHYGFSEFGFYEFNLTKTASQRQAKKEFLGGIQAPLYQQAFKFFREKYGYDIFIKKQTNTKYQFEILLKELDNDYYFIDFSFKTYKEAEKQCLDKLIKLCRKT